MDISKLNNLACFFAQLSSAPNITTIPVELSPALTTRIRPAIPKSVVLDAGPVKFAISCPVVNVSDGVVVLPVKLLPVILFSLTLRGCEGVKDHEVVFKSMKEHDANVTDASCPTPLKLIEKFIASEPVELVPSGITTRENVSVV